MIIIIIIIIYNIINNNNNNNNNKFMYGIYVKSNIYHCAVPENICTRYSPHRGTGISCGGGRL